ncbi:sensor histidine kinase [Gordonia humi]|uniref:histidine kinase n=1 Tax=Gordonia humi TaxID=686429 RepID=A0A840F5K2_9ACTN|nr:HAMP domain-containing sensor histidine kinase [Gordonia humi]MBB4137823.1 two-component system OmpR family sensor kinase [Gordonia humi]
MSGLPARIKAMPLRVTLVLLTVVLVLVGLGASGVAVTSAMRSDLVSRVDSGLNDAINGWAQPRGPREIDEPGPPGPRRPPSQYFVATALPNGFEITFNDFGSVPDLSALPAGNAAPSTVDSVGSGPKWRAVKSTSDGVVSVVAIPLSDVDATMTRLIWLQVGVGLIVVLLIGGLSYLLVRTSLRPLRRVEETAHAIAGGDLNRRVPPRPANTEVGSLGESVNSMLAQIQGAFAATAASEQQARASEEKMRRFVADASHELRTPLTSIKGFAELMSIGAAPDPSDAVRRISGEADRMTMLVEDLLVLARLDAQRPLDLALVDVLPLLTDSVEATRASAPGRRIDLDLNGFDPATMVSGDRLRLRQVLGNLLGNAIAHTDGDISVTARIDEGDVVVEVSDHGPGLTDEERDHVFERFYRGDPSRHRDATGSGSGLGLSIVAALVHAHGGRVGVRSEPGEGACFWFALPRAEESAPQ